MTFVWVVGVNKNHIQLTIVLNKKSVGLANGRAK